VTDGAAFDVEESEPVLSLRGLRGFRRRWMEAASPMGLRKLRNLRHLLVRVVGVLLLNRMIWGHFTTFGGWCFEGNSFSGY